LSLKDNLFDIIFIIFSSYIIDIIIKHNTVNLRKNQDDKDRLDFFSKKFNIDKDLDSVYFFELDDNILNFTPTASSTNMDINRLKYNNILLYFILIFITELNGAQIGMMYSDKIANIYVYLKYGDKLFGDLLIKKNINDMETVPITKYPVLCYLLFYISKYLISHKLWLMPVEQTGKFNPFYQKIIINSFVDMFNSISMDAGKMKNDYVYLLTSSKLYTQLNGTFKNNEIINLVQKFIEYGFDVNSDTTLINVSTTKNLDLFEYLVNNGADIHMYNDQCITYSASLDDLEMVKYLKNIGLNLRTKNDRIYELAIEKNFMDILRYLSDENEFPNYDTNSKYLVKASKRKYLDVVKLLIDHGVNINYILNDDFGSTTALTNAVQSNRLNIVKYLVYKGADIHVLNDKAIKIAKEQKYIEIVNFLENILTEEIGKISLKNIFEYSEKEIDDFLLPLNEGYLPINIQEKRYLVLYYLYRDDYLIPREIVLYDINDISEAIKISNTYEDLKSFITK